MFFVYALYSASSDKIYIGYTRDIENRMYWHNIKATKGFTCKFRPWIVVYQEDCESKKFAMMREKQLKSAQGRLFIRKIIQEKYLASGS